MVTVKVNHIPYDVPMEWDEVTYIKAIGCIKHIDDKAMQLSILTDMPFENILKYSAPDARRLFELITFTERLDIFESTDVLPEYKDFDFGSVAYGTEQKIKQILSKEVTGYEAAIDIIKILLGIDISHEPFKKWVGTANFFLTRSLISTEIFPSLEKMREAKIRSKNRPDLIDYKILVALEHTLRSQGQEP